MFLDCTADLHRTTASQIRVREGCSFNIGATLAEDPHWISLTILGSKFEDERRPRRAPVAAGQATCTDSAETKDRPA